MDKTRILNSIAAKELKELCRNNDLKGYSSMNKTKLIDFIIKELSDEIIDDYLKQQGLLSEDEISDEEVLAAMNTSRKMDDKKYLSYLLISLNVSEIRQLCKDYYLEGCSKHTKKIDLLEFILDSLSEEEHRLILYHKELDIISSLIDTALNKISGKDDREQIQNIRITNEQEHELELDFKGWSWDIESFLSITPDNIDNPDRDCSCRVGADQGFCNHFWVGFIFSVKNDYIKLSDWTLTKLPDDFEEKIKSIKLTVGAGGEKGEKVSLIDESSDDATLLKHLNSSITVYEGEATEVVERQSEFQEHITINYHITLKDVRLGPKIAKKSDFKEENIIKVEKLKVSISERLQTENNLKAEDKISVNGKLVKDSFWGIIVKNIRKVQKI